MKTFLLILLVTFAVPVLIILALTTKYLIGIAIIIFAIYTAIKWSNK
jgi:hypothetical protein